MYALSCNLYSLCSACAFLRMTLLREREERQKAEEINKQLEERAKNLEMTAQEAAEGKIDIVGNKMMQCCAVFATLCHVVLCGLLSQAMICNTIQAVFPKA